LGGLYLALVAGDVVSKEVEEGTMRMMLCRPVSRLRILTVKYVACVIYTFALILFIGLTALGVGIARQGAGGLFAFDPFANLYALYEFRPGLLRYLGSLVLLSFSLLTMTSLGFALSCFKMKPAAATIVTLSVFFLDSILRNIPYFESLRHWFLTTHMATWINVFRPEIPIWRMVEDYGYLFGANVTFVVIGAVAFLQRDLKT
jgi:ABC-2 type transport system permease protein